MNKQEGSKMRYYVQWDTHARHMCTVLCSLMEHQSLVDLAICCGTNTIHAHKCVLAANSPYFREQLEKNAGTEQVVITGLDFAVVKSIVEFMYCGETNILDENLKYIIAAAKFFQMRGLQSLASDHQEIRFEADSIHIPAPIFLPKKPKYPNAYRPLNNSAAPPTFGPFKNPVQNDPYIHRKIKRKFVRSEAEKACAKEAAASRLALEALQKELANTTQMSSFVIEESCTETTVENFIPHSDETFIENLNNIESVPLQVVNYDDLNNSMLTAGQMINIDKTECANNILQYGIQTNSTKDKLKRILGTDIPGNVEIMFKTSDGSFVNVTDDVLQNLSGGTLLYQIVDENGQVGETRELQVQEQTTSSISYEDSRSAASLESSLTQQCPTAHCLLSSQNEECPPSSDLDLPSLQDNIIINQNNETIGEFGPCNETVSQIIDLCNQKSSENQNHDITIDNISQEDDLINVISLSSNSSPGKTSNNTYSSESKIDESDSFIDALSKSAELPNQNNDSNTYENYNAMQTLNTTRAFNKNKGLESEQSDEEPGSPLMEETLTKSSHLDSSRTVLDVSCSSDMLNQYNCMISNSDNMESCSDLGNMESWKSDIIIDGGGDTILNTSHYVESVDNEDGSGDYEVLAKRAKFGQINKSFDSEDHWQMLEDVQNLETYSPRKTRSTVKAVEDNVCQISTEEYKDVAEDTLNCSLKLDKPRRIMPSRKKKLN